MRPRLPKSMRMAMWAGIRSGLLVGDAADAVGVSRTQALSWFREAGGVAPAVLASRPVAYHRLTFTEREDIAIWRAERVPIREIARRLGRSPGTISKEISRNRSSRGYRASVANTKAEDRARRLVPAKAPATNLGLRREVQDRLEAPPVSGTDRRPVAGGLPRRSGDVGVATRRIYQSLFVQGRGELRRELTRMPAHRPGRAPPRRRPDERRGRIRDMVMICSGRPRSPTGPCPGHWEGDLIIGSAAQTAIGTLVERTTRFVMLLHLPTGHGAEAVRDAMLATDRHPAHPAAPLADLGPGQRDGQPRRDHRWPSGSRSTSATRTAPGSAAATRTPTVCCASTSPRAPTCPCTAPASRPPSPTSSTTGPANVSSGATPAEELAKLLSAQPNPGVSLTS